MTNEEVMQLMTDMGLHEGGMDDWVFDNAWVMFANAVASAEREACAKLCEDAPEPDGADLAERIRARGNVATNDTSQKRVDKTSEIVHEAQRTWVGLTDDEILKIFSKPCGSDYIDYAKAIEAKLKEKNT